ncbi:hypothetical protein YC2023_070234 [Brassica napus]
MFGYLATSGSGSTCNVATLMSTFLTLDQKELTSSGELLPGSRRKFNFSGAVNQELNHLLIIHGWKHLEHLKIKNVCSYLTSARNN